MVVALAEEMNSPTKKGGRTPTSKRKQMKDTVAVRAQKGFAESYQ